MYIYINKDFTTARRYYCTTLILHNVTTVRRYYYTHHGFQNVSNSTILLPLHSRLQLSKQALARDLNSVDAHKGAGLALAHLALEDDNRRKDILLATEAGMTQLRRDNYHDMVVDSEDTWLVSVVVDLYII